MTLFRIEMEAKSIYDVLQWLQGVDINKKGAYLISISVAPVEPPRF